MKRLTGTNKEIAELLYQEQLELSKENRDVESTVQAIIEDVKKRGDEALRDYSAKFDKVGLTDVEVGQDCEIGIGEYADSLLSQKIYNCELAVIGEGSSIPDGVKIGKNVAISGKTEITDYPDGKLPSGGYIIKAGEI